MRTSSEWLTSSNNYAEDSAIELPGSHPGHNIPQLVGLEDGTVLVEGCGWQQHLTPYFRPLPQIKQYQHFSFDALEPGVVAKEHSDSVGTRFQLLRDADILPPIDGLPVQAPQLDKLIFLRRSGSFMTKRLWTSHSQGQDRNRLSEYRFPSCVVRTDQSSAHSQYVQCLYLNDSLITQMTLCYYFIYFVSCCSATLPLIVCI